MGTRSMLTEGGTKGPRVALIVHFAVGLNCLFGGFFAATHQLHVPRRVERSPNNARRTMLAVVDACRGRWRFEEYFKVPVSEIRTPGHPETPARSDPAERSSPTGAAALKTRSVDGFCRSQARFDSGTVLGRF